MKVLTEGRAADVWYVPERIDQSGESWVEALEAACNEINDLAGGWDKSW